MASIDDINRTLGAHGESIRLMSESLRSVASDVKSLVADKHRREGGRKITFAIAAAAGGVVSTMVAVAHELLKSP